MVTWIYLIDEKKADFEVADERGQAALFLAVSQGHLDILKYLRDEKRSFYSY
jgi:hypothetical protein